MCRNRTSGKMNLAMLVLAAMLLAAPIAAACMGCSGEPFGLLDGEFWGGG